MKTVRIWSLAEPGALMRSLFDDNGDPIGEYDMVMPVEIVPKRISMRAKHAAEISAEYRVIDSL